MIRRVLLGAALIGASLIGLDCELVFPPAGAPQPPNQYFAGCFRGPVAEPAGTAELTIVLDRAPEAGSLSLVGCLVDTEPRFDAALAGMVLDDRTQARFTVMPQGRPAFVLRVERQPPESSNAVTLTLVNETGIPFVRAPDLPRCTASPMTCVELGIPQAFVPGGAP